MTEAEISLVLRKKFLDLFTSKTYLDKIGKGLEPILLKLQRDRTDNGVDIYGRKFGGYNKSYNKARALKYASAKYGTTEFAGKASTGAGRTPLRLTGQLFAGMVVKYMGATISGSRISMKFMFTVKAEQQPKAEGLMNTSGVARNGKSYSKKSWMFLGLSVSGSNVSVENNAINNYIRNNSKLLLESIKK